MITKGTFGLSLCPPLDSTAAFKVLNSPLRELGRTEPHPLPVTVSFLSDAIGKLRAVGANEANANQQLDLWRGMRDLKTSAEFKERGGTELAPMSTTSQLKVALAYSDSDNSLLFKASTPALDHNRTARVPFCAVCC